METDNGFTDRILKDIHNVMLKHDLLAFDVVPVDENIQNRSPVLHFENWLGLESWCVKHVYMNCYAEVMDSFFSKPKRKALKVTPFNCERLTHLLNVTLLLNPELSSLWNKRREMLMNSFLNRRFELIFTKLVLTRKPKCNEAFSYRRWLLNFLLSETKEAEAIENIVTEELRICEQAADKCPNNYHSWNHRTWFIQQMKKLHTNFDLNFLYIKEYEFSERWTAKHISDYSCFHYRQCCIKNLFTINNAEWKFYDASLKIYLRKKFATVLSTHFPKDIIEVCEENLMCYSEENLVKLLLCYPAKSCKCVTDYSLMCRKLELLFRELVLANSLIRFFTRHETLWYHRRFIVHELLLIMYEHFGLMRQNGCLVKNTCKNCNLNDLTEKHFKIGRYDTNQIYSSILFIVLLNCESTFIKERQEDNDIFAEKYKNYLKVVEGIRII